MNAAWRSAFCVLPFAFCACSERPAPPKAAAVRAESVLLITIDTLRADHVGAYGSTTSHTPALDALARGGTRFEKAWAPAPITLTSHASLLTGRYPPGHGARHNGVQMSSTVPTLAAALKTAGFQTAAFVSAFPLDRRFGLQRGFDIYDDELPRESNGRAQNERAGAETVSRAIVWLQRQPAGARLFLWVHLFEPHAPYGDPRVSNATPVLSRYDEEIAVADREAGRLLAALGERAASTLVVAAADHGEAFGEHGEIGHSIFVYDTTLRVPLIFKGPRVPANATSGDDVSLVDVAPTILALLDAGPMDVDGRSLVPAFSGHVDARVIYAESFAPLFDFGWASLRAVRDGQWKYIAAPKPELYDLTSDAAETRNRVTDDPQRAARLDSQAARWSPAELAAQPNSATAETVARLRSLGYVGGSNRGNGARGARPDPKDRIALAARIASVTSGEVQGDALIPALEAILKEDPQNPQAHLRLGYAQLERNQCARAEPHFRAAIAAAIPSADAGLGLANCLGKSGDLRGAAQALEMAQSVEPGNPVVIANIGLLELRQKETVRALEHLRRALSIDPGLLEVRFELALALARSGDRQGATQEAEILLKQLPAGAPQRPEVERLLTALR
jgi:choline-sulfatase